MGRYYNLLHMHKSKYPEAVELYVTINDNLSLSKSWLFLMRNEEKFIYQTQISGKIKFVHPVIYFIRKFRKIFFNIFLKDDIEIKGR